MTERRFTSMHSADQQTWRELESLRDSAVVSEARNYADNLTATVRRSRRSSMARVTLPRFIAAIACGVAVLAAGIAIFTQPVSQQFATAVGEHRTVVLDDGSQLLLDTDTAATVVMTRKQRRVALLKGQANFEVAHDSTRPFRVSAGPMIVTAIGTNFDVAALPGRNTVTLIRGRVAVRSLQQSNRSETGLLLQPGQRVAVIGNGTLSAPKPVALSKAMAWQAGRIDLEHATVTDAIAEVNRYSPIKITLRHAAIGTRHIDGVFRSGDVDAMAAALCAYFDLHIAERSPQEIVLDTAPRPPTAGT